MKKEPTYQFSGNTTDIVNNVLSLLYGKEQYGESIRYASLVNDTQPAHYKNKMIEVLKTMQKENLISTRYVSSGSQELGGDIKIAIREQGKEVLAKGGYKMLHESNLDTGILASTNMRFKYGSIVAIVLSLIAAIWFIIS